ncbi:MAG: hypothetical protein ABEJ07_03730 [Candidatus Nanohaloarchaea archaeon]
MPLFGSGSDLHNLAEEIKDELQKEEHEVELSEEILQDLSDALERFENIEPDIQVLQDLERVDLNQYMDDNGTVSPAALSAEFENVEKFKQLERDLPEVEQEAAQIERDLKEIISDLREKDELYEKIGQEESDIENKISQIEEEQIPMLEDAVEKAEHLQ